MCRRVRRAARRDRAHPGEPGLLRPRYRDQHPSRRFGEQHHEGIGILGQQDPATGLPGQRRLDDGRRQAALGQVVGGTDHAVARARGEDIGEQLLAVEIDLRRQPAQSLFQHQFQPGTEQLLERRPLADRPGMDRGQFRHQLGQMHADEMALEPAGQTRRVVRDIQCEEDHDVARSTHFCNCSLAR